MVFFIMHPDKAYREVRGQLYIRNNPFQTLYGGQTLFEHTQSIFPPDVHAVMDHGKRGVANFPIATGVYYKHDYCSGVDISRYKNLPDLLLITILPNEKSTNSEVCIKEMEGQYRKDTNS